MANLNLQFFFSQMIIIYTKIIKLKNTAYIIGLILINICLAKNWILYSILNINHKLDYTVI